MSIGFFPDVASAATPFTNMVNMAKTGLADASSTFGSGSLFQNPLKASMPELNQLMTFLPSSVSTAVTTAIESAASETAGALAGQVMSMKGDISTVMAAVDMQQRIKMIDATASGQPPNASEVIDHAFPSTSSPCPGFNIQAVLAPITQAKNAVGDIIKGILKTVGDAAGKVFSGVQELIKHIQGAGSSFLSTLTGAMSSLTSSVQNALSSFKNVLGDLVSAAKDMVKQATDFLKSALHINLLNHPHPCVAEAMRAVTKPDAVNEQAVNAAKDAYESRSNVPVVRAVSRVKNDETLPAVERDKEPAKLVPQPTDDMYTTDEKRGFRDRVRATYDEMQPLEKIRVQKLQAVEEWKQRVNYVQIRDAAGAIPDRPETYNGTSSDPAANAAWMKIKAEYTPMQVDYNTFIAEQINPKRAFYKQLAMEYSWRIMYGRHPYTTHTAQSGLVVKPEFQTTILDEGK